MVLSNCIFPYQRMDLDDFFTLYPNTNSEWITDLNVRAKTKNKQTKNTLKIKQTKNTPRKYRSRIT